ncbi:hypothetical protein F5X96DRAFT_619961 [Biscogniauxia mediterranea]|nr:hypothetical protein F5X96DRAFT_619961 [Biscogniauxia mediterranea]
MATWPGGSMKGTQFAKKGCGHNSCMWILILHPFFSFNLFLSRYLLDLGLAARRHDLTMTTTTTITTTMIMTTIMICIESGSWPLHMRPRFFLRHELFFFFFI